MAGGGRGRVVGALAAIARLAMACGIGCVVFAAAVAVILADDASPAVSALAADLGTCGAMLTIAGLVVEQVLRVARGRPAAPAPASSPSWHNQPLGQQPRSRPRPVPARQPQVTGWWSILGVQPDAPPATFEGAARNLLRQSHPDRWATADPIRRHEAEGRTRIILQALAEARAASGPRA